MPSVAMLADSQELDLGAVAIILDRDISQQSKNKAAFQQDSAPRHLGKRFRAVVLML